jgi:hypothetical protein
VFLSRTQARPLSTFRLIVSLLAIALVLFAGTLSVTHSHAPGALTHADCNLCATAHAVVQVAAAPAPVPIALVFTMVEATIPPARIRTLSRFALFTRPPPADAPLS